ncbi:MAG: hypothetical protein U1F41_08650 [Burkholderiales bacterium]
MKHPPFADKSLLGTCIQLAHATFYEALPSNVEHRAPIAPRDLAPKRARAGNPLQRAMTALDNWFYRQSLRSREAYLAQSQNIFELEARMRDLDRGNLSF